MLLEAGNLPEKKTALENELITVQAQMNKLRSQEKELTHAIDTATVQLERSHSPADDRVELEQLWASQARVKQESRERHQALLAAGIAPHELAEVAKSPIDEALARKGRRSIPRLFALPAAPEPSLAEPLAPPKLSLENQLRFPGNPWLKAHWNITEQMKVMKADAKKAERMAAAAGVDVNAVRPVQ